MFHVAWYKHIKSKKRKNVWQIIKVIFKVPQVKVVAVSAIFLQKTIQFLSGVLRHILASVLAAWETQTMQSGNVGAVIHKQQNILNWSLCMYLRNALLRLSGRHLRSLWKSASSLAMVLSSGPGVLTSSNYNSKISLKSTLVTTLQWRGNNWPFLRIWHISHSSEHTLHTWKEKWYDACESSYHAV